MPLVCDTATVPAADRAELWVAASSELFVPLECTPRAGTPFQGILRAGSVGPVRLCALEATPHTVRRTPRLASNTRGDQYKLSLSLGGEALIVQDGREAVLRPGDFTIYDCSRPYTLVGGDRFRMLVGVLPRDVLGIPPERVARITATRIPGSAGLGWAMAPFVKRLTDLAVRGEIPVTSIGWSRASSTWSSRCARALWERTRRHRHTRAPSCCSASAPISSRISVTPS